ncbi:MAG: orotate phosphoribosyltransferase [Thermoplasmata archaeon]|nr:orotate phosphoribosyltransferase [Thermoplasmata archaeon]MCI4359475.1 orotate phosphoribosyltransferase [Thermoplasmata archaeon]
MEAHTKLVRMLRDSGAVRFGQFTLASGRTSDVYVDIKRTWTDPDHLEMLGRALAERVEDAEGLGGMELGAVPLLAAASLYSRRPFVVVRKAPKGYGTDQRIEGTVPAGARFLVIEDVTTSGGSVLETVTLLRAAGADVERVLVVVDREEGAAERLAGASIRLDALATLDELRGPPA